MILHSLDMKPYIHFQAKDTALYCLKAQWKW